MKKIGTYLLVFILSIVIFLLGFNHDTSKQPGTYYNVYLDNELVGMIESKEELDEYINSQADTIRENIRKYSLILDSINSFNYVSSKFNSNITDLKSRAEYYINNSEKLKLEVIDLENIKYYLENKVYKYTESELKQMEEYKETNSIYSHVENIYTPNGIETKKVYTYDAEIVSVPEIYRQIIAKKSCTIAGYKFTIKSDNEEIDDIIIYTLDKEIFSEAIEKVITIFINDDKYEAYKNDSQIEIDTVGSIIENVYVEEDITYKAVNISVEEKIYTDATELSAYLLYGDGFEEKTVKVKVGDTIESISFDNKISVQEFLIFNNKYTSRDNLLATGTDVTISTIDPKIQIVVETYEVTDKETDFNVIEKYDDTLVQGTVIVTQEGQKGIERVSQNVKSINGEISYVDPAGKEVIKTSTSKIITIGTKYIPNVGSTTSWGWPTNSGYTISSYYGYRLQVFGEGNFHSGIDIAGTGYGSPVKAANNGTIEIIENLGNSSYGKYIMINHNNGYYSVYGHMSGFAKGLTKGTTVSRGQVIGYVGSSGWATGPHLHFEIRTCSRYACTTNPFKYY